jgi:glycosyltransferase involved in cell wall biosynthesis
VPVLLRALARLAVRGLRPALAIAGSGPQEPVLRALAAELGVAAQVRFLGTLQGEELARAYARHRVLAVPSVWQEPFGLVALEALACGCLPVVADSGALPQAAGPAGVVVPRGDAAALADALAEALADEGMRQRRLAAAPAHLAPHRRAAAVQGHLALLHQACGRATPLHAPADA